MANLSLNERRGLNRQEAIRYLGVKGTYFDKEIRPLLKERKMGTSVVYDRLQLDTIFDEIMLVPGDVGPNEKGLETWPKETPVFTKQKTVVGGSTKPIKGLDFKDALQRIKQRKNGC